MSPPEGAGSSTHKPGLLLKLGEDEEEDEELRGEGEEEGVGLKGEGTGEEGEAAGVRTLDSLTSLKDRSLFRHSGDKERRRRVKGGGGGGLCPLSSGVSCCEETDSPCRNSACSSGLCRDR